MFITGFILLIAGLGLSAVDLAGRTIPFVSEFITETLKTSLFVSGMVGAGSGIVLIAVDWLILTFRFRLRHRFALRRKAAKKKKIEKFKEQSFYSPDGDEKDDARVLSGLRADAVKKKRELFGRGVSINLETMQKCSECGIPLDLAGTCPICGRTIGGQDTEKADTTS